MSEFKINTMSLNSDIGALKVLKTELFLARADLAMQILKLDMSSNSYAVGVIKDKLCRMSKRIGNEITNINNIINTGNTICSKVKAAENSAKIEMNGLSDIIGITWPFIGKMPKHLVTSTNILTDLLIDGAQLNVYDLEGNAQSVFANVKDGKIAGSLLGKSRKLGIDGKVFGMNVGADVEYSFLNMEGKVKKDAKWDVEKGEIATRLAGNIGLSVVTGKVSGNAGCASWEVNGKVGNVGAEGEIGASLMKGGKFDPEVYLKAKAKASVAEGEASGKFGTNQVNVHGKAEGSVLAAEAEATARFGKIKDKNGKEKYGVSAKAGAEAYLAEGKVSGGFTLFGIKIDASIEGKAGGVGAKVGGEATTGGVEGEIGAGLGLGLGLKIKVDWSGLKVPWQK